MYLAAESELRLLQSCHKSELAYLQQTQERESARIEAKKVLRELKHEGERQREINEELYSQIAQLVAETEAARDRCAHDIREAQRLQADMEEEDKDMLVLAADKGSTAVVDELLKDDDVDTDGE